MLPHAPCKSHQIFVQLPKALDPECPWHPLLEDNTYMLAQSLAGTVVNPWNQIVLGVGCHFTLGVQIAQAPLPLNSSLKQIEMFCQGLDGHIEDYAHDRLILQIHRFLREILEIQSRFYPTQPRSIRQKAVFFLQQWLDSRKPRSAFVLSAPIAFASDPDLRAPTAKRRAPSSEIVSMAPSLHNGRLLRK